MLKQSILRKSSNRTKTITKNTTCCKLLDSNEVKYYCVWSRCSYSFEEKRKQSNKNKHLSKGCSQPSVDLFASNASRVLYYSKVCKYLKIGSSITIEDMYKYNKK